MRPQHIALSHARDRARALATNRRAPQLTSVGAEGPPWDRREMTAQTNMLSVCSDCANSYAAFPGTPLPRDPMPPFRRFSYGQSGAPLTYRPWRAPTRQVRFADLMLALVGGGRKSGRLSNRVPSHRGQGARTWYATSLIPVCAPPTPRIARRWNTVSRSKVRPCWQVRHVNRTPAWAAR
jgi:hypothetical protein